MDPTSGDWSVFSLIMPVSGGYAGFEGRRFAGLKPFYRFSGVTHTRTFCVYEGEGFISPMQVDPGSAVGTHRQLGFVPNGPAVVPALADNSASLNDWLATSSFSPLPFFSQILNTGFEFGSKFQEPPHREAYIF